VGWLTPGDVFIPRLPERGSASIGLTYRRGGAAPEPHGPNTTTEDYKVKTVRHSARARIAAVGIATSGALILAGCGAANESGGSAAPTGSGAAAVTGTISGAGASTQQAATQAWVAGFNAANPDATINYDPSGSGAGRTQFIAGGVDYAGSDSYLKDDELAKAKEHCAGDIVELPVYISPIAIVYNLPGVADLQLSPATIAKIFDKKITKWNDPAIVAENAGKTLPDTTIAPVNRSDKSGTTSNFTDYLATAAKADWPYKSADTWPIQGGEAAQGTSGVIGAVKAGQGTIGYADESQAGDLGKVKVKVGDSYVAPSPEGAAKVVEASERVADGGQYSFAYKLARTTTDATAYPVTLVSYAIACAKYPDAAKAALVKAYLGYVVSADGQAAAAQAAGSSPLSDALRTTITPAVNAIS
jgi:phosphate transport system substrate-binding protein